MVSKTTFSIAVLLLATLAGIMAITSIRGTASTTEAPDLQPPVTAEDGEAGTTNIAWVEVERKATEAQIRDLFVDGLSAEELTQLWEGYPYEPDPKAERIARYLRDFDWVQASGGISVEVNFYEQFNQPEYWQPVVTAQSTTEAQLATSFVLTRTTLEQQDGGDGEPSINLGRIPQVDVSARIVDGDENSFTVDGIGTEGYPAAFYNGVSLEVTTDHEALTTTVAMPSDYDPNTPLTLVFPTPELPGASAIFFDQGNS